MSDDLGIVTNSPETKWQTVLSVDFTPEAKALKAAIEKYGISQLLEWAEVGKRVEALDIRSIGIQRVSEISSKNRFRADGPGAVVYGPTPLEVLTLARIGEAL